MNLIGYWWSDKKDVKIQRSVIYKLLKERGFKLVKLRLDIPFEKQGDFLVVAHKISDLVVYCMDNQNESHLVEAFEKFVNGNPMMRVLDPLDKSRLLMNRADYCEFIRDDNVLQSENFTTPSFVRLTTKDKVENLKLLREQNISFPILCKPLIAHGKASAHQIWFVFSEKGIDDIEVPCIAQEFVQHNARLFKVFVIGDNQFIVERSSLKNFEAGDFPSFLINAPDISKANSTSELTDLDHEYKDEILKIDFDKIHRATNRIREIIGLKLFGIDVIVERLTGRHAIVDLNYFPGYDGVPDAQRLISDVLANEAILALENRKKSNPSQLGENGSGETLIKEHKISQYLTS